MLLVSQNIGNYEINIPKNVIEKAIIYLKEKFFLKTL